MKPFRVLPLTVLFASTAFSQDLIRLPAAPASGISYDSPSVQVAGANCPVGMAVDRNGLYSKREVAGVPDSSPKPQIQQRIRLDFTNNKSQQVTGVQVTIHGLSQKTRYMQLSTAQPDMAKKVELSLDLKGKGQSSSVLWLTRFAAISRVDLNSVTYADGSSWHEPTPAACSVAPSLLVRVGSEPLVR